MNKRMKGVVMRKRFSKGFTLLELLVVISIIGLLVAMGWVSFTNAQKKGRDARRTGDMKAIQAAFEQYRSINGAYATTCSTMASAGGLVALPTDPKPSWTGYTTSGGCTSVDTYCICATMEGTSGNYGDASCVAAGTSHFCVKQLQ